MVLVGVTVFSLLPVSYLPSQAIDIWDKAQHAGAYALLACTGLMGFREHRLAVLCGLLLHGLLIEMVQHLLDWRQGDMLDWVADGSGVLTGYLVLRNMVTSAK